MKFNNLYFKKCKDMFNLYNIIQKINPGFRLYFNTKNKKYVIVNIYKNNEICLTFDTFLENIESNLRFSNISNFNSIIKHIEEFNQKICSKNETDSINKSNFLAKELLKISNRSNTINNSDINKIIGATQC